MEMEGGLVPCTLTRSTLWKRSADIYIYRERERERERDIIGVRDCPYGICCPWCVEDGTWMLWGNSSAVAGVVVATKGSAICWINSQ